jgi:hypothetical protein
LTVNQKNFKAIYWICKILILVLYNKTYYMRKLLFCFFIGLITAQQGKAQAQPSYVLDPNHPAYATGNTFSSNPEFLRGFCFAWDATSPVVQFGATVNVFRKVIETSASTHYYTVHIWVNPQVHIIVEVEAKWTNGMTLEMLSISAPNTSDFYMNAVGIRDYAVNLPTQAEIDFWFGYAAALELASYDPNFLLIRPGNVI